MNGPWAFLWFLARDFELPRREFSLEEFSVQIAFLLRLALKKLHFFIGTELAA